MAILRPCVLLLAFGLLTATALGPFSFKHALSKGYKFQHKVVKHSGAFADPEVIISNGTLRGTVGTTANGQPMYQYLGVPYAAPPVGDLRFKPPQPFQDAWGSQVREAKELPPACPQIAPMFAPTNEDCLFLNIFSTASPAETSANLPVIVFIHGGGFSLGESGLYTGEKVLNKPSVLVTIQYRLGPLGFLSTADAQSPGNYGLKDQVQALRWVQENIWRFGGDPNTVTIYGVSAGGASVIYHMISPKSAGLFRRAYAASGSAISYWALDKDPLTCTQKLAEALSCPTGSSKDIMDCMRDVPADVMIEKFREIQYEDYLQMENGIGCGVPTIEPASSDAFLAADPMQLLKTGKLNDVPLMIGATWHEGSEFLATIYEINLKPNGHLEDPLWMRDELLPALSHQFGVGQEAGGAEGGVSEIVAMAYMPQSKRETFEDIMPGLVDFEGVLFAKASVLKTAELLSSRMNSPVFLYNVEQLSENSLWNYNHAPEVPIEHGVTHGDDMIYVFTIPLMELSPTDLQFSEVMTTILNDFAKNGNPTPKAGDQYPIWPRYNHTTYEFLKLKLGAQVGHNYASTWTPRGFDGQERPADSFLQGLRF